MSNGFEGGGSSRVAEIIDLEEERRKRRRTLVECQGCGRVLLSKEARVFADDAELFVLCHDCRLEYEDRELFQCECGREVLFLYHHPRLDRSLCAVCWNAAQGTGPERR
ncbi:MAG: hypothetical protein CW345_10545 [Firmicutes bacterium]|nr:hypothetical protein [Bacillota bacterium]